MSDQAKRITKQWIETDPESSTTQEVAYLFLDEGGNFDFSTRGTRYFTMTSVLKFRPFEASARLDSLRYDLIESGLNIEYLHASEDRQAVRNQVFDILCSDLSRFEVDSIIVEKSKTHLLGYVLHQISFRNISEVIVITDQLPIQKKRKAVEKGIKLTLKDVLPKNIPYRLLHHSSKSTAGLQIADYFNWAIFRAWERDDPRSLSRVESCINGQMEEFQADKSIDGRKK